MENLITKPSERTIRSPAEVEEIRSSSLPGVSIIHVEVYDRLFEFARIEREILTRTVIIAGPSDLMGVEDMVPLITERIDAVRRIATRSFHRVRRHLDAIG